MTTTPPADDIELPKRKKGFSIARKMGKAYIERKDRRREKESQAASPLHGSRALSGRGRLHLREEERGRGTLIVNGSVLAHLNETALVCLRMVIEGEPEAVIIKRLTKRYKVRKAIATEDLRTLLQDVEALERGRTPRRSTRVDPLSGPYSASFRADLAVTYRDLASQEEVAAGELTTEEWLSAIDNIKRYGIPHVCMTGGEPTVREDLVEFIDQANKQGLMVGLLTDGERIGNKAFLGRLMDAGLDYVQVTIASHDEAVHGKVMGTPHHRKTVNGIRRAIAAGLPTLVNIVITKESEYGLEETVDFLIGLGARHITVNPKVLGEDTLPDWMQQECLERARRMARGRARVFWYGPVPGPDPRKDRDVEAVGELAIGDLEWGGGRTHIYVNPDGSITAGRGHGEVLGNVLTHQWNMLWYHPVLKDIRAKRLEEKRWRSLQEQGFNGYPLFPNLPVVENPE
jgi:MoaA/NifB/PqqE/SkfB family radical SAM enzyme